MSSVFDETTGARTPCTVLQMDRCQVVGHKTREAHGYWAVQLGFGWKHSSKAGLGELGHASKTGVPLKEEIREFRVRGRDGLPGIGTQIRPSWFQVGQLVSTRSKTKGKGFAGVSWAIICFICLRL
jgi:large subunit ribosomal protein L3